MTEPAAKAHLLQCGDQKVKFDPEKTRKVYSAIPTGDAERCGCASCLNFAAQRQSAYPEVFRLLLDRLGVDWQKEGEAYECGLDGDLTVYGGWFYFVGELVQQGEQLCTDEASGFQYFFASPGHFPKPHFDFGKNVAAVEFITKLPQVLR